MGRIVGIMLDIYWCHMLPISGQLRMSQIQVSCIKKKKNKWVKTIISGSIHLNNLSWIKVGIPVKASQNQTEKPGHMNFEFCPMREFHVINLTSQDLHTTPNFLYLIYASKTIYNCLHQRLNIFFWRTRNTSLRWSTDKGRFDSAPHQSHNLALEHNQILLERSMWSISVGRDSSSDDMDPAGSFPRPLVPCPPAWSEESGRTSLDTLPCALIMNI